MPRQARKVELENPRAPIVCVDLNGVLDAYTGWKDAAIGIRRDPAPRRSSAR